MESYILAKVFDLQDAPSILGDVQIALIADNEQSFSYRIKTNARWLAKFLLVYVPSVPRLA